MIRLQTVQAKDREHNWTDRSYIAPIPEAVR